MLMRNFVSISLGSLALMVAAVPAHAQPKPDSQGFYKTGEGVRKKKVAIVNVDVYRIAHYMKELPPQPTKAAVANMNTEKKLVWTMLRDVDNAKIVSTLRDAYALNGYPDKAKVERFISAFNAELKKGANVTIHYQPSTTRTTVTVGGGGTATVEGADFMRGTWAIWFGKIDQPSLGDDLISAIKPK